MLTAHLRLRFTNTDTGWRKVVKKTIPGIYIYVVAVSKYELF